MTLCADPSPRNTPNRYLRPSLLIDGQTCYRCTACNQWKSLHRFYRLSNPKSRRKRQSLCKACCNRNRKRLRICRALAGLRAG